MKYYLLETLVLIGKTGTADFHNLLLGRIFSPPKFAVNRNR